MAYDVEWLLETRIVYIRASGIVSYDELAAGIKRLHSLYDLGKAPVHSISDGRLVKQFPTSLELIRKLMRPHPKGTGWSLLIQENPVTAFVSEMVTRLAGQSRVRSFKTLEEGLEFLRTVDESLGIIPMPDEIES